MKAVGTFQVVPSLPPRLERLRELAHNLRWTWDHDSVGLFHRLDRELWDTTNHNPVLLLGRIDQRRLDAAANDAGFLSHFDRVTESLDAYLASAGVRAQTPTGEAPAGASQAPRVAYFSFEFGLTECLRLYSGGLGVLAGDHLKSASDLNLPLVGVGLLYQEGYFQQHISADGRQTETFPANDFATLPVRIQRLADGSPVHVHIAWPDDELVCQVWRAQVGRVPLYLLDTNLPENPPELRRITQRLYGGDSQERMRQEIVLGIGGVRALTALGLSPTVFHMNEGHAAFLGMERIRVLMETPSVTFAVAREAAAAGTIFTSHTPVAAGIDLFPPDLVDAHFRDWYEPLGLPKQEFLALGQEDPTRPKEPFSMAVLALRLSAQANGVSALHGQVTRRMWPQLWPAIPADEVPIGVVTNGVHIESWVSDEISRLYDRYLGPGWHDDPASPATWRDVEDIPAEELWRAQERSRERLVSFARRRVRDELQDAGASARLLTEAAEVLDPTALTIGFARRFATYKRATLIFHDLDRLAALLKVRERPTQLIFAGKAHPRDQAAKDLMHQVVQLARSETFRHHIVFLADYDMYDAQYLVQGADVWLATSQRPLEASGTSGMKAVINGALHLSVLDGWWNEGYSREHGWAIGGGDGYGSVEDHDRVEAEALYALLESEIIPLFYQRGRDGLPRDWIGRMKASIQALAPRFNSHRMVSQYEQDFYLPAEHRFHHLAAQGLAGASALASWKDEVMRAWPSLRVDSTHADLPSQVGVGDSVDVRARIHIGTLPVQALRVELLYGQVDAGGELANTTAVPMDVDGPQRNGSGNFRGTMTCRTSGELGFTVRVLPHHPDLGHPSEMGLICWAATMTEAG